MYTKVNGKRVDVDFQFAATDSPIEHYGSPQTGSNKGLLIAALIVSILAVIISSYLLYKNIKNDKQTKESFGYRLY